MYFDGSNTFVSTARRFKGLAISIIRAMKKNNNKELTHPLCFVRPCPVCPDATNTTRERRAWIRDKVEAHEGHVKVCGEGGDRRRSSRAEQASGGGTKGGCTGGELFRVAMLC